MKLERVLDAEAGLAGVPAGRGSEGTGGFDKLCAEADLTGLTLIS